jgi:hypothetical protein
MKAIHTLIKAALLVVAGTVLTPAFARADTYSWQNLQSDISGVPAHVDPNLVNPWGMAVGSSGIIWVSDNGTGVSTLYNQDGTANPLVVAIPAKEPHQVGNPTGIVFNSTEFFKVTKSGDSQPSLFIFVNEGLHLLVTPLEFEGLWDLLPLGEGVYLTAGIADEEHGLFGIITED